MGPRTEPDHSRVPVLDALADHKRHARGSDFFPPGHKQGAGVDPTVREVPGPEVFSSDAPTRCVRASRERRAEDGRP